MINGVSGSSSLQYHYQVRQETSLTDEQKTTLSEIIAQYDPENMSKDDMKTMMDEIKSANIPPSKDLKEIMDAAGFEPPKRPEDEGAMPPPPQNGSKEIPGFIQEFMQKQESGEATQDDFNQLLQTLQEKGFDTTGLLFDQKS